MVCGDQYFRVRRFLLDKEIEMGIGDISGDIDTHSPEELIS